MVFGEASTVESVTAARVVEVPAAAFLPRALVEQLETFGLERILIGTHDLDRRSIRQGFIHRLRESAFDRLPGVDCAGSIDLAS